MNDENDQEKPADKIISAISELSIDELRSVADRFRSEIENRDIFAKRRAVEEIKEIARKANLIVSFSDVEFTKQRVGAKAGTKAKIKYRDKTTGNEWSGRGLSPAWITEAVRNGKNIDDYLTDEFKID